MRAITHFLCSLGWHHEEPVTATVNHGAYVLLRCTRCSRDRSLMGSEAAQWIAHYLRAS